MISAAIAMLLGKLVHAPFGQAGPVRSDETATERRIRLQHCYVTDSVFIVMALTYLVVLIRADEHAARLTAAVGLVICLAYVFNSCVFLYAMRVRSRLNVRVVIANYVSFTLGLLTLLVTHGWTGSWQTARVLTMVNRSFATLFFAMGAWTVSPLWSASTYELPGNCHDAIEWIVVVAVGLVVWGCVILAADISSKGVWQVVINSA